MAQLDLLYEAAMMLMLPHAIQVFIFLRFDMSLSHVVDRMLV
jgi:hypothetical protein